MNNFSSFLSFSFLNDRLLFLSDLSVRNSEFQFFVFIFEPAGWFTGFDLAQADC